MKIVNYIFEIEIPLIRRLLWVYWVPLSWLMSYTNYNKCNLFIILNLINRNCQNQLCIEILIFFDICGRFLIYINVIILRSHSHL